jgi:hypothetical protein
MPSWLLRARDSWMVMAGSRSRIRVRTVPKPPVFVILAIQGSRKVLAYGAL